MSKKKLSLFFAFAMVFALSVAMLGGMEHSKAESEAIEIVMDGTIGAPQLIIDKDTYTYLNTTYDYTEGTEFIISGTSYSLINPISVKAGVNANITLNGFTHTGTRGAAGILIAANSTGNVTVTIADGTTNSLGGGQHTAGIQKDGVAEDVGTLTINGGPKGTGILNVSGGGAAIGGGESAGTRNIIINGGVINATGGGYAAAIGGGCNHGAGDSFIVDNIVINGGKITATGGTSGGAGIGGSAYCVVSNITINGGVVLAKGGTSDGCGIGAGCDGSVDGITINGGIITADGGGDAYDIGSGNGATSKNIIINGGSVKVAQWERETNCGVDTKVYNSDGKEVVIKPINNPQSLPVYVGDRYWNAPNHTALDSSDYLLYCWLPTAYVGYTIGENVSGEIEVDLTYGSLVIYEDTYKYGEGVYSYEAGSIFVLKGTTNKYTVTVDTNVDADIVLNGLDIQLEHTPVLSEPDNTGVAFRIKPDSKGDVTITIADGTENILLSSDGYDTIEKAGILKTAGKLTIKGEKTGDGKLNVGSNGGYAIGNPEGTRNIQIDSGDLYVSANFSGTGGGIGGKYLYNFVMNGGTVETVSFSGYALGCGTEGDITINGGNLTVYGRQTGHGSGGEALGVGAGTITINDGTVISGTRQYCCAISAGDVIINGGHVTSTSGTYCGGIQADNITITDGVVIAKGATNNAGLFASESITISGGTVTATGGYTGIGGSYYSTTNPKVIISGGSVNAVSNVTVTNGSETVTMHTIENPNSEKVWINRVLWSPVNHLAADSTDTNLYAWYPDSLTSDDIVLGKLTPKYTAPTAKTVAYTGKTVELVNPGTTEGGTIQYRLSTSSTWSETIPTASGISSYKVYWRIVGDENYNSVSGSYVTSKITKATQSAPTGLVFNDETVVGLNDGTITGLTTAMQVSTDNGVTWTNVTDPNMTFAPGEVLVRYKATSTHNASTAVAGVIGKGSLFKLYGVSMTLANSLRMNFFVETSYFDGTDYYAVVTKEFADGRDNVVVEIPYSEWGTSGKYKYFSFDDISAKEMTDKIYVEIFDGDGNVVSIEWTDTVQDYAMRVYAKDSTTDKLKTLIVEMLKYGAQAQISFDYNTENMADEVLTDEMLEYAMDEVPSATSQRISGNYFYGVRLTLKDKIEFKFYYKNLPDDDGMYAVFTYKNHKGVEIEDKIPYSEFVADGSYHYVYSDEVLVADVRQVITCTLYNSAGEPISISADSIEGYVARTSTEAISQAVMKFSVAAYDYLHE